MLYSTQDCRVFVLHPLSDILNNTAFWKLDVFSSSGERVGGDHRLALSNRLNITGTSHCFV
jgi:hypothetical protein